jgi:hypothetical protein
MEILKDPKEYAKRVKELGFTKEEFCQSLMGLRLPADYILACLDAWEE